MGPRRDRESKAARAARPSAGAPSRRPPLKPAPPVTDCLKCRRLAEAIADARTLRRRVSDLESAEQARTAAALAGVPITLSDEQVDQAIKRAYHGQLEQVLAVAPQIALDVTAPTSARLTAAEIVVCRVAGKVKDRVEHSGALTLSAVGTLDVYVHAPEGLTE